MQKGRSVVEQKAGRVEHGQDLRGKPLNLWLAGSLADHRGHVVFFLAKHRVETANAFHAFADVCSRPFLLGRACAFYRRIDIIGSAHGHRSHGLLRGRITDQDLVCPNLRLHSVHSGFSPSYSTLTRNRPLAGAVAAAAERSRASRMRRKSWTVRLPLPIIRNVPTRFLTMWGRNPLPRTG